MSFLGRALGQFLNRWMTDKVANSSAIRQTAKVAVKGVKSIQGGAKVVCEPSLYQKQAGEKAGEAAKDVKNFASEFWGELKNQATGKSKQSANV